MRKLFVFLLLLGAAFVWANPAELIDEGEYKAAYQEALAMGGAEGYALAAQAASFYAGFKASSDKEKEEWYSKAEKAAKKAIEIDPDYPEGHFELARTQGRLAQFRGILASLGLASSVRDNLNEALKLRPGYDEAMVALAIWNLELAQKGVGWMYGASTGRVIPLFEKAISINPTSIAHRLEYGNALIRLKKPAEARVQLEKALELPANTYADRMNQEKARKLLEEIR